MVSRSEPPSGSCQAGDPEPQKFLRLWVADDGPGMSPELQTQLFQENFSGFLDLSKMDTLERQEFDITELIESVR